MESYINHNAKQHYELKFKRNKIYFYSGGYFTENIIYINLTLNINQFEDLSYITNILNIVNIAFEKLIDHILNQLNDFTKCFELYLFHFVNKMDIKKISFIQKILSDDRDLKVINFNYTNTLSKYDFYRKDNVCHIHGEAFSNDENNLVLGINETEQNIDPMFTRFRKYFQRFEKNASHIYRSWITIYNLLNQSKQLPTNEASNTLHIVGHSLTLSDKNILYELITLPELKTIIYYHSDSSKINLMQNLAAILGYQKFTEYMESQKINFEKGMFQNTVVTIP